MKHGDLGSMDNFRSPRRRVGAGREQVWMPDRPWASNDPTMGLHPTNRTHSHEAGVPGGQRSCAGGPGAVSSCGSCREDLGWSAARHPCHGGLLCAGDPIVGISFDSDLASHVVASVDRVGKLGEWRGDIIRCHRHPCTSPSYRFHRNT